MEQVGYITEDVFKILGLTEPEDAGIYMGQTNIDHMKSFHAEDYRKYGHIIPDILRSPDYVGLNQKDHSIEYVKEIFLNDEYVKVALRVSRSGRYFVRSMYVLNPNRVRRFVESGGLKPLDRKSIG